MARMPKYQKIYNAQQRAAKKKKESSLWTFINSGFFLWLLSAVVITSFGAIISAREQCVRTGKTDIEKSDRVTTEIAYRFYHWSQDIPAANSTPEAINILNKPQHLFAEFKETSLAELFFDSYHFDFSRKVVLNHTDMDDISKIPEERLQRFTVLNGGGVPTLKDDDLPDLKTYVRYLSQLMAHVGHKRLEADCSPSGLVSSIWTGRIRVKLSLAEGYIVPGSNDRKLPRPLWYEF